MAASRRLKKELADLQRKMGSGNFKKLDIMENNILLWQCVILPTKTPFNNAQFTINIVFPAEYPFKPPKVVFKSPIYHPNVDEKGQVCLPIINAENWKPAVKTDQVIQSLIDLVDDPEPEHPLRADIAEEYAKNRDKYIQHALDRVKADKTHRRTDD